MVWRVILDCDPGHDDALALLLALASREEIELLAVTTVSGNAPLARTSENARKLLTLIGRTDVPVFAGCARPILVEPAHARSVHGESGLDGAELPEPTVPLAPGHAVEAIVRAVLKYPPGTVRLCAVGPLTNLALAVLLEPAIVPRLAEIVVMGGAIGLGNVTPAAEFNFWADPHAAAVVVGCGAPITLVPLDLTRSVRLTPERLAAVRALGTPPMRVLADLLAFYDGRYRARGEQEGAALHDPCAVAWILRPELFTVRRARVAVETDSDLCRGRSVVDLRPLGPERDNARVLTQVDTDGFFDLLIARLARL